MSCPAVSAPESLLESVREDRESGSRELLERLLDGLIHWLRGAPSVDPKQPAALPERVAKLRPGMAAFTNAAALMHDAVEGTDPDDRAEVLRGALVSLRESISESPRRIAEVLRGLEPSDERVMTFSRSGTVTGVLGELASLERIVVLHSYPGAEGVSVARSLQDRAEVTFIYDAEAGGRFADVDALYLGADALGTDGTLLNKTGSRLLARAARDVPVRVLADGLKLCPGRPGTGGPTVRSPEELSPALSRDHPLFETVPPRHLDTYATDRGVARSPNDLAALFEDLLEVRRRFDGTAG